MSTAPDDREALGRAAYAAEVAFGHDQAGAYTAREPWEALSPALREMFMRIGVTVVAAERERAERAEARPAEIRGTVAAFLQHYGNSTAPSFQVASDLAHAVLQVLDREPLEET